MRFDTEVFLQTIKEGSYDPASGNYSDDEIIEQKLWANVNDTSAETMNIIYGAIQQGSVTVRFQNTVPEFDYLRIGDKRYRRDYTRKLRTKTTYIMSEVQ